MATSIVEIKALECKCERCGHVWNSFMGKEGIFVPPVQCTKCKNIRWNVSRDAPKAPRKPRTKKVKVEDAPIPPAVTEAMVEAVDKTPCEPPKVEVGITVSVPDDNKETVRDEASE